MNYNHLIKAINSCDAGIIRIQKRRMRAFLFNHNWYPLRAVINHAIELEGNNSNLTTEESQTELLLCLNYVNVKDIMFQNGEPVGLTPKEKINQIDILQEMIIKMK